MIFLTFFHFNISYLGHFVSDISPLRIFAVDILSLRYFTNHYFAFDTRPSTLCVVDILSFDIMQYDILHFRCFEYSTRYFAISIFCDFDILSGIPRAPRQIGSSWQVHWPILSAAPCPSLLSPARERCPVARTGRCAQLLMCRTGSVQPSASTNSQIYRAAAHKHYKRLQYTQRLIHANQSTCQQIHANTHGCRTYTLNKQTH